MFEIRGLDHLVLRVSDPRVMVDFYCGVLGCTVERELDIGLIQLRAGNALVDLVPVDSEIGRRGGPAPGTEGLNLDHFCLRIDPFDEPALRAHLSRHGIEGGETATRYGAEGYGPSIYIRDPQGNTVELRGGAQAAAE